jgi:APA family basic amino acid/polyamine antiporter
VALSLVQVGGFIAVIAVGVPHLGSHSLTSGISLGPVVGGAALVFFAFIGFDEVITLSEESEAPSRDVPRPSSSP